MDKVRLDVYVTTRYSHSSIINARSAPIITLNTVLENNDQSVKRTNLQLLINAFPAKKIKHFNKQKKILLLYPYIPGWGKMFFLKAHSKMSGTRTG